MGTYQLIWLTARNAAKDIINETKFTVLNDKETDWCSGTENTQKLTLQQVPALCRFQLTDTLAQFSGLPTQCGKFGNKLFLGLGFVFHRFTVNFDDAPATRRLQVEVDVSSIDFDSGDINDAVVGEEWFDTGQYPRARFSSERIESTGDGQFRAVGKLELKGIQRTVEVPFQWLVKESRGHLRGELQLQRKDFRIGTGEWATATEIGQEVDIRFDVRLQRSQDKSP